MKSLVTHFYYIVSALLVFLLPITSVSAISDSTLDFLNKQGIYYYNPDKTCYSALGSYDGVASAGLSNLQSAFVDTYHDIAEQLSAEYGIPWEAVMAQGILESAAGTSRFARERYNFFGLGAVDSNPDNAYYFSSAAEGWKGYFDFINKNSRYRANGAFNYPGNPYGYIQAIKNAGYATDENYVAKLAPIIKAIENRSEEKGWKSSAEIAAESGRSSTGATIGLGSNPVACSSSGDNVSEGNGDINSTALALSWPDRSHAPNDPNDAYRAALAATGVNHLGDVFSMEGRSCDAFVATVLRYSGADTQVPCCGAARMLNYFLAHPELYEEIPNTGSSSNLRPGDIRSKSTHVEIYVETSDGVGHIASASHPGSKSNGRTADHAALYYPDSAYHIFRLRSNS